MYKGTKKVAQNIEAWLLGFEKQAGIPVVVSLLIEKGGIRFMSCFDKGRFFDLEEEAGTEDEAPPPKKFNKLRAANMKLRLDDRNYIG